jgi:hypothetical protein
MLRGVNPGTRHPAARRAMRARLDEGLGIVNDSGAFSERGMP